ncbi:hypothetical protein DM01DRAFT_1378592 [Hesseltinella vesiculosa]|uniref:Uncharacterized protein n=1 Tax=Hesseltinella vesiculosa TaxID=101127 RepID=A0A1X2G3M1_9FUNG|nr:hypothetical protein DM01DRAFT_1378592 [Hesseltinella vesiculosa]
MNTNDNSLRPNPQECHGCRFPCQQVLLHSPLVGNNNFNVQEWWESLLSVEPPIAGLAHVRQFGDSLSVHSVNPRSAHFFFHHPARWRALMSTYRESKRPLAMLGLMAIQSNVTTCPTATKSAIWHETVLPKPESAAADTQTKPTHLHGSIAAIAAAEGAYLIGAEGSQHKQKHLLSLTVETSGTFSQNLSLADQTQTLYIWYKATNDGK